MKFLDLKLVAALFASVALAFSGPAWSAGEPKKKVRAVAKHKYKTKAKTKAATPSVVVPVVAAAVTVPVVAAVETAAQTAYVPSKPLQSVNPYLAYQQPMVPINPAENARQIVENIRAALPSLPEGQSLLPSIKKVYPTGEKPLVVVTFKCPTELIGITPIPTKLLHDGVNGVFDLVNTSNVLSFNLQQVCQ